MILVAPDPSKWMVKSGSNPIVEVAGSHANSLTIIMPEMDEFGNSGSADPHKNQSSPWQMKAAKSCI
jgi:hypothetical protein